MTPRLNRALLQSLRSDHGNAVAVPDDAILDLPERAVQFGTGALLRGFVDDFLHRANAAGTFGGRVVAIASTGSVRDRSLREQDGLYTLVVEGIEHGQRVQECRIISSVSRALSATDQWPDVLALAHAPLLEYVFSNTTEVGIVNDFDSGPDAAPPRSFPAKLTRFLYERARAFEFAPSCGLTVIPCELIEDNGVRLHDIVLAIARRWTLGNSFVEWLETSVPFCNTLVDRIVPGTPHAKEAGRLAALLGYDDALLTCCEPYRLFAVQGDEHLRARLTWATVDDGIIVAPDILPYRERKVHLLNGAHSLLAPVALQSGCETVLDAMRVPAINHFVRHAMLDEIAPTLGVGGTEEFAEAVLDRFQNPFIRHALIDITLQATMKIRVRVVPSIVRSIANTGQVPSSLAFGFAAFLLFMQGSIQTSRRERSQSVPVDDHGAQLQYLWSTLGSGRTPQIDDFVSEVCRDTTLWGTDLTTQPGFCAAVADHLGRIRDAGVSAALDHHLTATLIEPVTHTSG